MDKKFSKEEMEGRIGGGCKPVGLPDQGLPVSCFSSRADAADILHKLCRKHGGFDALISVPGLRFGEEMCEGLQQTPAEVTAAKSCRNAPALATDVEEGFSHLAFSDCPAEVRRRGPGAATLCIDGVRDPEIQKALRVADLSGLQRGP
ncbi:hypothetical protein TNCV_3399551 [Trichonephila clavipes]|nr:hypothetical protein TNCV_3399551 [Trichonephila clavipes]